MLKIVNAWKKYCRVAANTMIPKWVAIKLIATKKDIITNTVMIKMILKQTILIYIG